MTRIASTKFWLGLVLTLIGIAAAQPLLRFQFHFQMDTLFHLQRVAQVEAAWRTGILFPRFSPDLGYGFGFPILGYYAPLLYYLIAPLHLAGVPIVPATAIVCTLIFVIGAWGMYALASAHMDSISAIIAAASYALAPYIIGNALIRGALAEHLGLALVPWAMVGLKRVSRACVAFDARTVRSVLFGALPIAALLISHNLSAFLAAPLLGLYALYLLWVADSSRLPRGVGMVCLALLALALSAFFWLPVMLERDLVQLNLIYEPTWSDVRNNLLTFESQFRRPIVWDRLRQFDEDPSRISLFTQVLAVLALGQVWVWRRNPNADTRQRAGLVLGCALVAAITLFMIFKASVPLWNVITPLRVLQFPWRMLGPNALAVALLAGLAFDGLRVWGRPRLYMGAAAAALVITVLYVFPRQIISWPVDTAFVIDTQTTAAIEQASHTFGTTIEGEFTPKAVRVRPDFAQSVFTPGNDRIWRESLPASVALSELAFDPLRYRLRSNSPQPFTLSFRTFFFEGWHARIGSQTVQPFATEPHGLLSIAVPAGEQAIEVWFGNTPIRELANALSLIGLACWLGFMALSARLQRRPASPSLPLFTPTTSYLFAGVLFALLLLKTFWVDAGDTPFARSRFTGNSIAGISHPAQANFNNEIIFMGADLPASAPSGGQLKFTAYWRVAQPAPRNLTVGAQLMDEQGALVGQENHESPGALTVTTFKVGYYVRDEFALSIAPGTPPGQYRLVVYAHPYQQPNQRLTVLQDGSIHGVAHEVGRISIARPTQTIAPAALSVSQPRSASMAPGLLLAGFDLPSTQANSGDRLPLTLYWQSNAPLPANLTFEVLANGTPLPAQPLVRGYDTQQWQAGDVWRAHHTLWLPPSLPPGKLDLAVRVGAGQPVSLNALALHAPQHQMTQPPTTQASAFAFGSLAQLAGYDAPKTATAAGTLALRLVWRALGEGQASYKVFVHLQAADGSLVASDDAIPAAWTRPTHTWLRDEYIVDERTLKLPANLPAGRYALSVGLYDEQTGERLALPGGETQAPLGEVMVK